ncbi:sulfotransferase family protein [Oceanicella actignis]|nr:sulfotransferase family protein [Oceanicella actignis]
MAGSANISPSEGAGVGPVVLVGQARSGSTLLAAMLNRAGGLMINDAYALQAADELGLTRAPRPDAAERYRAACLDILRRRSVSAPPAPLHRSAVISPEALARASRVQGGGWAEIWGGMLRAAAQGRAFHGWNTPPDHLRADEILSAFPTARFVFLMRDPYAVLRSYKHLPEYWGRGRARYHPALQARAWAASARSLRRLSARHPQAVHALRYEDLLADPGRVMAGLARFLGVALPAPTPDELPRNASRAGAGLTRAELWVARRALGAEAAAMGYAPPSPEGLGLGGLLGRSLLAGVYYAGAALTSRDMRGRMLRLARA